MNHLYIVTHTDLDGVGAAAAVVRILGRVDGGYTTIYAEPYNVHERLEAISGHAERGDLVVVTDLGPNRDSFKHALKIVGDLTSRGVRVEWVDHHIWSGEDLQALEAAGARVWVDRNTCATGAVVRHFPRSHGTLADDYLLELERVVCSADLWRWDHHLSTRLFRILGSGDHNGDEWRDKVLDKLARGILWDNELEERLQDYITRELEGYNRIQATVYTVSRRECRVAAAAKGRGPPANSFIGAMLLARYQADIAVIVRSNGGLSLRSRDVNVQPVASRLGGGGHPRASGARIEIPLYVRLASRIYPRALSWYAARIVYKAAMESGVCGG
ncbi:MAG: DHHA1 domain-containing protein [Desulfurococcales archaeon]|nr:DHHA1 domain-containing protein [Desulfurococcales archaeon]